MPRTVEIKPSHTPLELRRLAASTKDANQSRRLLSIAAVLDGMSRAEAAKIGGMDRQTLRDWVHRFNAHGPAGSEGQPPPGKSQAAIGRAAGRTDRRSSRPARIGQSKAWCAGGASTFSVSSKQRFGVDYHERTIGKLLKALGFSHISARPRHPKQDGEVIQAFKKTSHARSRPTSRA